MSLVDFLTGGKNEEAQADLEKGMKAFSDIQSPTAQELTLPELQKYVQAGMMTPAQAEAALVKSNAYNGIKTDPSSMSAEQKALGEMESVAEDGGMTPQMQAQLTGALDQVKTQEQGANGSILDQFAARGIPTSLMAGALQSANAGQESEAANKAATDAAASAQQNALAAMSNSASTAANIHEQDYGEQSNKAAAENAINEWNAQNQTGVNQSNADRSQAATLYNTQTKQNVSDVNTGNANARTQYNAQVPQTVFNDKIAKAGGQAGVAKDQANQATEAGKQEAGFYSGLIGAGATVAAGRPPTPTYSEGGRVPGHAEVPGDSRENDKIHALLSPGEVVVPRSVAPHPDQVKNFVQHLMRPKMPPKPVHPDDLHSIMDALSRRREVA